MTAIFSPIAFADDVDMPATGDLWDNWNTREEGREAKPVSDEDFDKAVKEVDKKVNKWRNWANKLKVPRGEEINQSNETEMINNEYNTEAPVFPVICVPVELSVGENVIPVGHYQVQGERVNGSPVLKLYQAHYKFAEIPAIETNDDFDQETINFATWEAINDNQIKLMYGSLDLNAYTIINIKK